MKMFWKKIFPVFVVLAFLFGGITLLLRKSDSQKINGTPPGTIILPSNDLDATVNIPGTQLMLPYPRTGFYGLGADVTTNDTVRRDGFTTKEVSIGTTAEYDAEKGSEYVTLDAVVMRRLKTDETLSTFVASLDPQSIEGQYAKSGTTETFGGHDYFVFKSAEDVSVWTAYTVTGVNIVGITLAYKPTDESESVVADKNNEQLFLNILSHVSAK
jgi:hypothetical protein